LDGYDIVINATEIEDDSGVNTDDSKQWAQATEYSYPDDIGWSSGASSVWGVMGLALVLGMMIFVVSVATRGIDF
jgi:hypothetical protein